MMGVVVHGQEEGSMLGIPGVGRTEEDDLTQYKAPPQCCEFGGSVWKIPMGPFQAYGTVYVG